MTLSIFSPPPGLGETIRPSPPSTGTRPGRSSPKRSLAVVGSLCRWRFQTLLATDRQSGSPAEPRGDFQLKRFSHLVLERLRKGRRGILSAGVCLLIGLPGAAAKAEPLAFLGARLGMPLEDWRALKPPLLSASGLEPRCEASVAAPGSGQMVCTYATQYGAMVLPTTVRLADGMAIQDPTYVFRDGRLATIRYHAPIDSFHRLNARFKARFGPPGEVIRDQVTTQGGRRHRVTERWVTPAGTIELVDPVKPATELEVRLSGARSGAT